MELTGEKREKLRIRATEFVEEIASLIDGKQLRFEIQLDGYYNRNGGLTLKINETYFGYTTYQTRFTTIYSKSTYDDDKIYNLLQNDRFDYYTDVLLDLLANRDRILKMIKDEIEYKEDLLDKILN
jgi:hypothetical protein